MEDAALPKEVKLASSKEAISLLLAILFLIR